MIRAVNHSAADHAPDTQTSRDQGGVPAGGFAHCRHGERSTFGLVAGDTIIEVVDVWHCGSNDGAEPTIILVFYAGVEGIPLSISEREPHSDRTPGEIVTRTTVLALFRPTTAASDPYGKLNLRTYSRPSSRVQAALGPKAVSEDGP